MGFLMWLKGEEPGIVKKLIHSGDKGHYGEYLTEYALEHGGLGEAAVFSNVIVPRSSGPTSTSEIDVVMLHEKGIFVIESKNYSGWIFGSADQRNWTVSFNSKAKERFYNPIKQNRSHVKALASWLALEPEAFHSFIVFSERCELKKVPPDTADYVICRRHHLLSNIRRELKRLGAEFDDEELARVESELQALADSSTSVAKALHVQEVKQAASGEVCPRCGSPLVARSGKYGKFIGCSSYPKCRYTRNL